MPTFQDIFFLVAGLGGLVAMVLSIVAALQRGVMVPGVLLLIGLLVLWAAFFLGNDLGYRGWQAIPDAPPEAFADSAVAGALLFGWIPAGLFCGLVFGLTRLARRALYGHKVP